MERLTQRAKSGNAYYPECFRKCDGASEKCDNCEVTTKICEKIAEYEELEEKELLIKLPCRIGEPLFSIEKFEDESSARIFEYEFDGIEKEGIRLTVNGSKEDVVVFGPEELGRTIFKTMAEAEKKLEEIGQEAIK